MNKLTKEQHAACVEIVTKVLEPAIHKLVMEANKTSQNHGVLIGVDCSWVFQLEKDGEEESNEN